MGMETQVIRVIEAVKRPDIVEVAKEVTAKPDLTMWIPIAVAVITVLGGIVTALIRRRK